MQRHSFILHSSFDQRLSLVILAAVCFTSFLAWPSIYHPAVTFLRYIIAIAMGIFFIMQWHRLKHWSFQFLIDGSGLVSCNGTRVKYQLKRLWISPFILAFQLHNEKQKRLVLVWRDMLDDTSYRHLCRHLLNYG